MVTVIQLPPQPAIKQLTAIRHSKKLEEHLLAFLNSNNKSGFANEECISIIAEEELYTISDVRDLLECDDALVLIAKVAIDNDMSVEKFSNYAKHLRSVTDKRICLGHCRELLARALGYKSTPAMMVRNQATKKNIDFIKKNEKASPDLCRNIKIGNKNRKNEFRCNTKIKNRRDPNSFKLKDIIGNLNLESMK